MRRVLRNGTIIEVLPTGSRVTLPNRTIIVGAPHDTDEYRKTAEHLGYGDDTLALCQEHDPLHAWLCDVLGLPDSPALRVAAGIDAPNAMATSEERAVLSVQEFCRKAGVKLFVEE